MTDALAWGGLVSAVTISCLLLDYLESSHRDDSILACIERVESPRDCRMAFELKVPWATAEVR